MKKSKMWIKEIEKKSKKKENTKIKNESPNWKEIKLQEEKGYT